MGHGRAAVDCACLTEQNIQPVDACLPSTDPSHAVHSQQAHGELQGLRRRRTGADAAVCARSLCQVGFEAPAANKVALGRPKSPLSKSPEALLQTAMGDYDTRWPDIIPRPPTGRRSSVATHGATPRPGSGHVAFAACTPQDGLPTLLSRSDVAHCRSLPPDSKIPSKQRVSDPFAKAPIINPQLETTSEVDEWLRIRLTPGGPLAIIEQLLLACDQGDACDLRVAMARARIHGDDFLKSLDAAPVEFPRGLSDRGSERRSSLGCFLRHGDSCCGVWTWAKSRLSELEQAEDKLVASMSAAKDAVFAARDVVRRQQFVTCAVEPNAVESAIPQLHSGERLGTAAFMPEAKLRASMSAAHDSGFAARVSVRRQQVVTCAVQPNAVESTIPQLHSGERVGAAAFMHAHEGLVLAGKELAVLHQAQKHLVTSEVSHKVDECLHAVDEAKLQLFDRFVEWLKPLQECLTAAVKASSAELLVNKIRTARRMVGAGTLLGSAGLAAAQIVGLGIQEEMGESEPPDPWNFDLKVPPWQVDFVAACQRLAYLRGFDNECSISSAFRRLYDRYSVQ